METKIFYDLEDSAFILEISQKRLRQYIESGHVKPTIINSQIYISTNELVTLWEKMKGKKKTCV